MKKILVIGGNGFLGKNIVNDLLKNKFEIGVYDLNLVERDNVLCYRGNIIDDENLYNIIKNYDTIIYLISAIMPQQSMDEPMSSYLTDIPLLLKLLEVCKTTGVNQIIYASSGGTIYGDNFEANSEEVSGRPSCHYGICKQTCENILLLYNKLFNMKNIILRISNPYGPYQNGKNGVGVITSLTLSAIKEKKIFIWGDGKNIRDFISVEEVAQAFIKAIKWQFDSNYIPVFNIGSGKPITINHIVEIIKKEIPNIGVEYFSEREFDVKCNFLNVSKATNLLGVNTSKDVIGQIRKYVQYLIKNEGNNEN